MVILLPGFFEIECKAVGNTVTASKNQIRTRNVLIFCILPDWKNLFFHSACVNLSLVKDLNPCRQDAPVGHES